MKKLLLLQALLFHTACFTVTVTPSKSRVATPATLQLSNDVTLTSWGPVDVTVNDQSTEFLPASFRIEGDGTVLYVDPVAVTDPKPADVVFVTHAHEDHFSPADIAKLVGTETLIVCPRSVAALLDGYRVRTVEPGDAFQIGALKVQAIPAYNLESLFLWIKAHPKSEENVGYVIEVAGTRILHAGDTDFVPEHRSLERVSVALVPIGGDDLTMDPAQAAALVEAL